MSKVGLVVSCLGKDLFLGTGVPWLLSPEVGCELSGDEFPLVDWQSLSHPLSLQTLAGYKPD